MYLYLNRFGFNGLHRVNRQAVVNVPGVPRRFRIFSSTKWQWRQGRGRLRLLLAERFAATMELATAEDVVCCDPRYSDLETQTSLIGYTAEGFESPSTGHWPQQRGKLRPGAAPL